MENPLQKKRKMLFVSAHPDDDSLVGGTMAKLTQNNWDVFEFVCSSGSKGKPNNGESLKDMIGNREKEVATFLNMLGAQKPLIYSGTNAFFENDEKLVLELVRYIREIQPDVTVLLNDNDYHYDHIAAHRIGLKALECAFRSSITELGERIKDGIILQTDGLNVLNNPMIYVDISEVFDKKVGAVRKAYGERLGESLFQFDEGLARMRGGRVGYDYAEAYEILNPQWYKMTAESAQILSEFVSIGSVKQKTHVPAN